MKSIDARTVGNQENQEALTMIRRVLAPRTLSYIEELVVCYTWEGKRYREMAVLSGYEEGYLKDVGSRLWQSLSEHLGYPVSKKRLRNALLAAAQSHAQSQSPPPSQPAPPQPVPPPSQSPSPVSQTAILNSGQNCAAPPLPLGVEKSLAYPGSPLPFGSPLYMQHLSLESLAMSNLQCPGGLLRIKAPWRMGKTSLINHLLGKCQQLGYSTVSIDIRQFDTTSLASLDAFLRCLCWSISRGINLTHDLDKYWFEDAGSKLSCTTYMQEHILAQLDSPLVIALDTCHYLTQYPSISENFFAMLRSWYEQAKVSPRWQNLRLILAHVADLELSVHDNQSPFNVGLRIEPACLTIQQIDTLKERISLGELQGEEAAALTSLVSSVGGHPYLIQLTYHWIQSGKLSPTQILQDLAADGGIYQEHLSSLWYAVQKDEAWIQALYQVLLTSEPIHLPPKQTCELADIGIVELVGHHVKLRCELYRQYFSSMLDLDTDTVLPIKPSRLAGSRPSGKIRRGQN